MQIPATGPIFCLYAPRPAACIWMFWKKSRALTAYPIRRLFNKNADAKKAEYDAIVQSQEEIKRLNDKLEKAKVREAREKKEAEEAEEKRKREETIESLSNGDTAAISKLLKQIRNADSLGQDKRGENLKQQLDAALEQYYKNHKIGDNKTIDGLPEAKRFQKEE